jgi:hypothetical protein
VRGRSLTGAWPDDKSNQTTWALGNGHLNYTRVLRFES